MGLRSLSDLDRTDGSKKRPTDHEFRILEHAWNVAVNGPMRCRNLMAASHSNDGERDCSSFVKASEAYKLAAKRGQPKAVELSEVFEMSWRGIYQHARNAGLSEGDARETTEAIMRATIRKMAISHDAGSVSDFKRWLSYFARQYIPEKVPEKENPGPYYASVAWRDKHRAA